MKKNIIVDDLSLNKPVTSVLDDTPMMYVIDPNENEAELDFNREIVVQLTGSDDSGAAAKGPKRSIRKLGECRYSRNHYTQCTEGRKYSRSGRCCSGD